MPSFQEEQFVQVEVNSTEDFSITLTLTNQHVDYFMIRTQNADISIDCGILNMHLCACSGTVNKRDGRPQSKVNLLQQTNTAKTATYRNTRAWLQSGTKHKWHQRQQ
jgi:hypothetical protein